MKTGSLTLLLPTACISRNPSLRSSSPVKVVSSILFSLQKASAKPLKYLGTPSTSPLPFAHSRARFLAMAKLTARWILGEASRMLITRGVEGFDFLSNL